MNSPFVRSIVEPLRREVALGCTVGTAALSAFTYYWYASSIRQQLIRTQRNCHAITESALRESKEKLKEGEKNWSTDIKARDAQVRRLELQNVEQTRSVARLEAAMKMCLPQSD